jgi:hypothetical protein
LSDDTLQVSKLQIGTEQISKTQINSFQIGFFQIGSFQESLPKIGITQNDTTEIGTSQLSTAKIDPLKVSFPSSITLQQLLSSHSPNLQNTTVPAWTEFLQSPTPFNLKIEIQDLPTGQLAEATITGYDTNNRPNSGTLILILTLDSNSLGWFCAASASGFAKGTTPDNTEFDQNLTPTAFRATTGAVSGKYDLLTTIHELGHLQDIIRGNTAFDTHVQNINGIPASLSPTTTPSP